MSDYWSKRNEEMKHIQSMFQTDAQYNKAITDIYRNAERNILKEIDSELVRYAGRENLSMDVARERVRKMDVDAFQSKAKRYVDEKNFTQKANQELATMNVKTRMNRLQMLQETIRLETIALADSESKLLHSRLDQEIWTELVRQSGLLGESVPTGASMTRKVRAIVEADFKGAKFSDRIWANQAELSSELDKVIQRTLIQGKHPREGARDLRRLVKENMTGKPGTQGGAKYKAERIAITESARCQTGAQQMAFEEFGIEQVEWVAENDACSICEGEDGKISGVDEMMSASLTIPAHSFCRCSYASVVDRNKWEQSLERRGL